MGPDAYIQHYTGYHVTVHPFTDGLSHLNEVPIVTACIAYDCPATLHTYVLFIHQALYMNTLKNHLLCPNQFRHNGVTFNDTPLVHLPPDQRTYDQHSIIAPGLHIPLKLDGVISYFDCRKPTKQEVDDPYSAFHIHVTSSATWDPKNPSLNEIEERLRATVAPVRGLDIGVPDDYELSSLGIGPIKQVPATPVDARSVAAIATIQDMECIRTSCALDIDSHSALISEGRFHDDIIAALESNLSTLEVNPDGPTQEKAAIAHARAEIKATISATHRVNKKSIVTPDKLAKIWKCGRETAKATLNGTTQLAVRDTSNVSGDKRLKPYMHILRYTFLDCEMGSDVIQGKCTSIDGNKYAVIHANGDAFTHVYPLKHERDAHLGLTAMFERWGKPRMLTPDGAGALTGGLYRKKAVKEGVIIHPREAYTPNQTPTEGEIRELRRGYRRNMTSTDTPECL